LRDIAERFDLIDEFLAAHTRETFLQDVKTRLAVVRLVEEICEAAYWFVKHAKGAQFRDRYPEIDFGAFGGLGNIYRHQYALVDYGTVWDDIHGADMTALRIVARTKAAE
jgi:uncharacterized protein with HEPN domain